MLCPYCDLPLADEIGIQHGSYRLHEACHRMLYEEMDALYGEPECDDLQQVAQQQAVEEEWP